ncbi:hypothetical protein E4U21_003729 [Claviceps maximensis]|nr:hypothetical protein E4U21_003729 [Claviceps maximensis]
MARTRHLLDRTTDTYQSIRLWELLSQVRAEIASAKKRFRDGHVAQETMVYLVRLDDELEMRLGVLAQIRRSLRRLPRGEAHAGGLTPHRGHIRRVSGQDREIHPQTSSTRRRRHGSVKTEATSRSSTPPDAHHQPFSWVDALLSSGMSTPLFRHQGTNTDALRSHATAITDPQVGQLYLGYWSPERRYYAVLVLPFGSFAPIGLPGSIASTQLLDCERRPCHTRDHQTGAYAWSYGFGQDEDEYEYGDGDAPMSRVLDREFPVIWFSTLHFPARAQYSWLEARHLRPFCLEKTPRPFWNAILHFVHERNEDGRCSLTTDLDRPPGNGPLLAAPAIRTRGLPSAHIDTYFDNVVYVSDHGDDENVDPTFCMRRRVVGPTMRRGGGWL